MSRIINISGSPVTDRGIIKLAEYVEANLKGYTLIIGCKPSIYDVDAVLIGNGNIFSVECKDWKGRITGGSYGWWQKDGQVIDNPLQQTRNNAAALGKWLRGKIPGMKKLWVKSILLFTHEEGELNLNLDKTSNSAVSIVRLDFLMDWIYKQKESLNTDLSDSVIRLFNQLSREEKVAGLSFIEKALFAEILLILAASIYFGFRYIKDPNGVFLPLLFLCMVIAIVLVIAAGFIFKSIHVKHQINSVDIKQDGYNPLSDFTNDYYNFFGTYNKR